MSVGVSRIATSFLLIVTAAAITLADNISDVPEAVSLYAKGKRLLRQGDWFYASRVFEELEARFPASENLDLFVFNRAKAKYYCDEYDDAVAGFRYYVSRYPNSASIAHACFFLGNSLYAKGNVGGAVRAYIMSYQFDNDQRLDRLLIASLAEAFENAGSIRLGEADFENLDRQKKCRLVGLLADVHVDRGEFDQANRLLRGCGQELDLSGDAGTRYRESKRQLEIALVLPLSGELHSYGEEIYNGAVIAAEFHRMRSDRGLKLVPYDSRGDPIEAARVIGELARSSTTDVIIGPLTSEEAAISSAALACTPIPMITPAATQAGLTRLSESSFQLSPNVELEGITLADYACDRLMADSAAIISSTSTDHLRMARAFAERFRKRGGTVAAIEYYRPRDKDFGPYIRDVKSILLGQPADSTYYINEDGDTLDFDIVPASIDCLFLPGTPHQLRQLLPQIRFYNLNAFCLGSDGWGDEAIYKLGDDITGNAVFSSPFLEGRDSEEYARFATAFDNRYGHQPHRLAALGYDAVGLVARAVSVGGISRENIVALLQKTAGYVGVSGRIAFGADRENVEMPLYRIESQQAVLVDHDEPAAERDGNTQ